MHQHTAQIKYPEEAKLNQNKSQNILQDQFISEEKGMLPCLSNISDIYGWGKSECFLTLSFSCFVSSSLLLPSLSLLASLLHSPLLQEHLYLFIYFPKQNLSPLQHSVVLFFITYLVLTCLQLYSCNVLLS